MLVLRHRGLGHAIGRRGREMRTPILDQPLIAVADGHVEKVDRVWSKNSCGAPVVFQQASEAFSTDDCSTAPSALGIVRREQQEVVFTLVIPFCVVVLGELS